MNRSRTHRTARLAAGTLLPALALLLVPATPAAADAVVLTPVADTSIFGEAAGQNNAGGASAGLFAGMNANLAPRRALVRFDLGAVPAGSTIDALTVRLHLSQSRSASPATFGLHRATAGWGEGATSPDGGGGGGGLGGPATVGSATWLNRFHAATPWATAGGDFAAVASGTAVVDDGVAFYEWTSTPALVADAQAWVNNPAANFGWVLLGPETGVNRTAGRFDARESTTADFRPRLTVNYTVPEPSAAAVAAAVVAAGLLARRRSSGRRTSEPRP